MYNETENENEDENNQHPSFEDVRQKDRAEALTEFKAELNELLASAEIAFTTKDESECEEKVRIAQNTLDSLRSKLYIA